MKNFVNENADFVATCAFSVPERRDLRFGSVHPKNRFLSLSLSLPSCGGVPAVADGTRPFGVSRSTRAECIFFRDDNYERNLLFPSALLPSVSPLPFIYRARALCPVGTALSRKKRAFVARLAVLVNATGRRDCYI